MIAYCTVMKKQCSYAGGRYKNNGFFQAWYPRCGKIKKEVDSANDCPLENERGQS